MRALDMLGQVFGDLTVVARANSVRKGRLKKKKAAWICQCSCGQKIRVPGFKLRRGESTICWKKGHGHYRTGGSTVDHPREYKTWESMRRRCRDKTSHKYYLYGARGITVCERWNTSFANFFADMGPRPTPKHTIDRKNGNGHYEPDNCRWATPAEQSRNLRNNVYVEYEGKRVLLMDIIPVGITRQHVYGRLRKGWPLELALSTPVKRYKKKPLDVAPKTT